MSRKDHRSRCLGEIGVFIPHGESEAPKKPDGHQLQACPDRAAHDFFLRGSMDLAIIDTCLLWTTSAVPWKPGTTRVFIPANLTTFLPPSILHPSPLCYPKPPACRGLEQCCKAKRGKIVVIIGETCSGDDNDNNFLKVSFQSCLFGFKSKAGRRTNAGALCRHESKSKAKRTKRKAEIPLDYIFIPPRCLSVLMGDNRHLFPVNVSKLTACAQRGLGRGSQGFSCGREAPGLSSAWPPACVPPCQGSLFFQRSHSETFGERKDCGGGLAQVSTKTCVHVVYCLLSGGSGVFFPFFFFLNVTESLGIMWRGWGWYLSDGHRAE